MRPAEPRPVGLRPVGLGRPVPAACPAAVPLRLTTRGRAVLAVLTGLLVCVLLGVGTRDGNAERLFPGVPAGAPAEAVVEPGDTLWSIAERVAPDSDPRGVVADLRRLNGLHSVTVTPGQRLRLHSR